MRRGRPADLDGSIRREWPLYRARLGRAVRDKRLELDVSRVALAAAIGSNEATIRRLENGRPEPTRPRRDVSVQTLFRIARGLGVSMHEVMP